jgi:WD40 repeat protein
MAEKTNEFPSDALDATGEFFSVGGPLHAVRPGYIRRPADDLLYDALFSGRYAHVSAPDRSGKSSLIASTSARLQSNGVKVAILDLDQIAERDGAADAGRWYYSIVYRLLRQLRLKVDLQTWWQDKAILSYRQRLVEFYSEVILQNVEEPVVVFVDQVQCTATVPFAEHLLASIRAAHNARTTDPEFSRLTFSLLGECDPNTLFEHAELSPFSISREITLGDFSRADLDLFATELNLSAEDAQRALDRIYELTSGHPYLSQKLARSVTREQIAGNIEAHIDRIAVQQLAGRAARHSEPHMSHIHRLLTANGKQRDAVLNTYGKLRKGIEVAYDPESRAQSLLLASGLVARDAGDRLKVKNRLYESVFTARWANENLPIHWRGPAIALGLLVLIALIPFLYTQVLPRPYINTMFDASASLQQVSAAHDSLRSFPGHADDADRLYKLILRDRAALAADRTAIMDVETYARSADPDGPLAEVLLADFWDRQVKLALREERRDDALIAALESLVNSTALRRRRAATLVGDDYPQLVGTIPPQSSRQIAFNPDEISVSFLDGAQVRQWAMLDGNLQEQSPWTISALEVTPLVRRVVVDRPGRVNRIGLSVNVSHPRLSDLLIKLIAPSGRSVDLQFQQASSSVNDVIRIDRSEMEALNGELLRGTWSLSIRDEVTGIDGHLIGWNLSLNSQGIVENFDRGLDIPDPVEKDSDNVWAAPDGRYAIARSSNSDGMRIWDMTSRQPARTIAVPANESVVGLNMELGYLMTAGVDTVNVWRTANGRRRASLATGVSSQPVQLSGDGRHLLVQSRGEANTRFNLWSLETMKSEAGVSVAGTPALVSIDANGSRLAIADYDRSVRVWDFNKDRLLTQFNLEVQPSRILLSPDGSRLGVVYGDRGVSLWHADVPDEPLLQEWQSAQWQIAFSGTGQKFLAGNPRYGFQVYRSSNGSVAGPLLGSGMDDSAMTTLAFNSDEKFLLTASYSGLSRLWQAPSVAATDSASETPASAHELWRKSADSVSAISPGGERIAIGDSDGHVHFIRVGASDIELAEASDEISYLGHQSPVIAIAFSGDGSLAASGSRNGDVRVWDAVTGLPRPYSAPASVSASDKMQFSPNDSQLAVNSGRRVWIMNIESGKLLTDIDLGDVHSSMAFADDEHLYLGSESGALRVLTPDRSGSWILRNVWQGTSALRKVEFARKRQYLVLVNAANEVRTLDIRSGRVSELLLLMPDVVNDVLFSSGESRVLLHTPRWVHRSALSPSGLLWLDAVRAPKAMPGSRMVLDFERYDSAPADDARRTDRLAKDDDSVLILTRETGFAEVAELQFSYSTGPSLIGNRLELLNEWRHKLAIPAEELEKASMLTVPVSQTDL